MPSTSVDKRKTICNFVRNPDAIIEEADQDDDRLKFIEFVRSNRGCNAEDTNLDQFVVERSQEMVDKFMETMANIADKWSYLGLSRFCVERRLDSILTMVAELTSDAEQWEDELVKYLEQEKTSMLKNLINLCKDLSLPDYEPPQGGGFMDMLNTIMEKHEELQYIKKERLSKWSELQAQKESLCKKLGKCEPDYTYQAIPSESEIQKLQSRVLELRAEYTKVHKIFIQNRKFILQLCSDLEMDKNSREITKYTCHEDNVTLSDVFMKDQSSFMHGLVKQDEANKNMRESLLERLNELWDKLEIDYHVRNQELHGIDGWKPSDLKQLTQLADKYEELKKQNMGKFIAKLRAEIYEYWQKTYASQAEKDEFEIYMAEEEFNEALLTAHEVEVERLKSCYQENRDLFDSLDKWLECWVKYLDLEKQMNDPNRFNNRGGVLLKQEREKKNTMKELTKCEKVIKSAAEKWSQNNGGEIFLVDGQPVADFIECQKTSHQNFKTNEKKEKQKVKADAELKSKRLNYKPTPNAIHRTPNKQSTNTPTYGLQSCESRLQNSTKPLSPANRELRSTRTRLQIHRLGVENMCNSTDRSRLLTPGSIKSTPNMPISVYGNCPKNVMLDHLIDEDKFKNHLQERKHETLESTTILEKFQ